MTKPYFSPLSALTNPQRFIMLQFADRLLEMNEKGEIDLESWTLARLFVEVVKRGEHE